MTAIATEEPVVLLIDEIDKTDQEFEADAARAALRLPDLDSRSSA
jgi:ATP-dependent Lon protease